MTYICLTLMLLLSVVPSLTTAIKDCPKDCVHDFGCMKLWLKCECSPVNMKKLYGTTWWCILARFKTSVKPVCCKD